MTKPDNLPDSAYTVESLAALTPENLAAGVVINKVTYNKGGQLTNRIVAAGMDSITIQTIDFENGLITGFNRYRRDIVLSFTEGGIPTDNEGTWNPLVCTVPNEVAMTFMKEHTDRLKPSSQQKF